MATVDRELSVEYGDLTIGGTSTEYLLTDVHTIRAGFVTTAVEFTFVIQSGSGGLDQLVEDVEANFTTPDQDLVIRQGSNTLLSLKQSDNTGLDAMPAIVKRGDVADTGTTRLYVVRIELGRPGNRAGVEGLRQNTVTVSYDPSRRRHVTISGEFTAFKTTAARAQYEAKIDALCNAALSALTGTFELALETALSTVNDKSATFSRTYDEVIFNQGGGGVANATIVRQLLTVSARQDRTAPQSPGAQTWTTSQVTYDCWIDKTVTQDLAAQWTTIRSFVISQASTVLGGGTIVVMSEDPRYDYDNNRITATMALATAPSPLISYTITTTDDVQLGEVLVPAWTGNPLSRYRYQGPARYLRTISQTCVEVGELSIAQVGQSHATAAATAKSQTSIPGISPDVSTDTGIQWVLTGRRVAPTPRIIGINENTQPLTEWTASSTYEKIAPIEQTTPSTPGGGSSATTPGGG